MMDVVAQELTAQPGPLWVLGQVGVISAITVTFGMLHRSAVNAYKESAAKSDKIADNERENARIANAQLMQVLTPLRKAGDTS